MAHWVLCSERSPEKAGHYKVYVKFNIYEGIVTAYFTGEYWDCLGTDGTILKWLEEGERIWEK